MNLKVDPERVRALLAAEDIDGWLLYDFQRLNPIARDAAGFGDERMITRRWFCLIPREGPPRWLIHAIERASFRDVPGEVATYAERLTLEAGLRDLVAGNRVAMEYSPGAAIPTASRVDAGTVELVRACGAAAVVSSADLVQALLAPWSARGLALHLEAAAACVAIAKEAFRFIAAELRSARGETTEHEVRDHLLAEYERRRLAGEGGPIVAANAPSADPHYEPSAERPVRIRRGDFVLVDVWAKHKDEPDGVYGDVTWVGFCGEEVPERIARVFDVVARARDRALEAAMRPGARGFEVDRAARGVIEAAGYGPAFIHRTGHSLGPRDHWIGANMDDYETHDDRRLLPGTGFTIEPGIYLAGDFGVRSEIDVYFDPAAGPVVTTEVQRAVIPALGPSPQPSP